MEESASFTTGPFSLLHFSTWQEAWPWHLPQLPQLDNSPSTQVFLKTPHPTLPPAELDTLRPHSYLHTLFCISPSPFPEPYLLVLGPSRRGCRSLRGGCGSDTPRRPPWAKPLPSQYDCTISSHNHETKSIIAARKEMQRAKSFCYCVLCRIEYYMCSCQ